MKEYQVNLYGKTITIIQDTDGKFVTPEIIKEQNKFGSCLKPAYEPIIVARKPFKGSLVDNVIENGVGGLNIDECRVGNEERTQFSGRSDSKTTVYNSYNQENAHYETVVGRFPANVILTYDETDFEEVCGGFPNTKSSQSKGVKRNARQDNNVFDNSNCGFKNEIYDENKIEGFNDSGSASRYFYCAKASKKDRDEGLQKFEDKKFFSALNTKNGSGDRLDGGKTPIRKNIHPTVKPIELMQYLIRLVSPKGATIMDCFMGSGSTGKAAMFENREREANYKFIGIELTNEYLPICQARIDYALNKYDYDLKEEQDQKELEIGQTHLELF